MKSTAYDVSDAHAPPKYALSLFTQDELLRFWPHIEEMLDSVPHTWRHWTKEHIQTSIQNDMIQVWGMGPPPKATFIMFTTVQVYPTMRVLCAIWGAGSFNDDMIPLLNATMTTYARLNNCAEMEVRGRFGWEPKLKKAGFRKDSTVWTCKVPNDRIN